MNKANIARISGALFLSVTFMFLVSIVSATIPQYLNINGRLANTTDFPQSDRFVLNFSLYTQAGGGNNIWTEIQNISVSRGQFNATLGLNASLAGVNFNQPLWLGIRVHYPTLNNEMTPRLRITSNAFAFRANTTFYVNGTGAGNIDMNSYSITGAIWFNGTNVNASGWLNATGLSVDLNTLFVDAVNDRVGIGTISPLFALDVRGSINSTAWINSTSLSIDGSTLFVDSANRRVGIGTASPSSLLHVRGTGNLLNVSNGTQSFLWVNDTSPTAYVIIPNGRIGIGTTSPEEELHVKTSNSGATNSIQVNNEADTAGSHARLGAVVGADSGAPSGGDPYLYLLVGGGDQYSIGIDNSESDKFKISKDSALGTNDRLTIDTSGSVGINTTSPVGLLNLLTSTGYSSNAANITNQGTGNSFVVEDASGDTTPFVIDNAGSIGIGTTSLGNYKLNVIGGINGTWLNATNLNASSWVNSTAINIDDGTLFVDAANSRVGIGTISPLFALDVRGSINSTAWVNSTALSIDGSTLFVDSANRRVGIGTAAPSSLLHIRNADAAGAGTGIRIQRDVSTIYDWELYPTAAYSVEGIEVSVGGLKSMFFDGRDGNIFLPGPNGAGATQDPASRLTLDSRGLNIGFTPSTLAPSSGAIISGNVGINDSSPDQAFSVQGQLNVTGGGQSNPSLFTTAAGNVGIGTTSPQSLLHVNSTSANVFIQFPVNRTSLASGDCDADSEIARMIYDSLSQNLFMCTKSISTFSWNNITLSGRGFQ